MLSLAVCAVMLIGPFLSVAAAQQWTDAYPGVRYLSETRPGPVEVRAVEVDLCASGVSFRATRDGEKSSTTSSFGSSVGAQVAINGDFYTWDPALTTIGMAMGNGELWSDDTPDWGFIAFGDENAEISPPGVHVPDPPGWMQDVVGGNIMVLQDGAVTADAGDFCTARHPRTVAGLSDDGTTLYLAVADGRSTASIGMTCAELGQFMAELGARDALNLDGGGSTTMWREGAGVVNSPSGGSERSVANHLAVHASGSGPAVSCPHVDWDIDIDTNFVDLDVIHTDGDGHDHLDVFVGDEFEGEIIISNQSASVIRDVWAGYWFEQPFIDGLDYTIYTDHPEYDQQTWVVNDANDAPENPEPGELGQQGELNLYAFSSGETKRIVFEMQASQSSIGMVDHPDIRAWVRSIEDIYGVQESFWDDPDTVNDVGETLRTFSELDVLGRDHWHFAGPYEDHFEGWRRCDDGTDQMSIDTDTERLVTAGEGSACVRSPDWTRVDADAFDELVIDVPESGFVPALTVEWEGASSGAKTFQIPSMQDDAAVVFPLGDQASWAGQIDRIRLSVESEQTLELGGVYFRSSSEDSFSTPYATDGSLATAGDDDGHSEDEPSDDDGEANQDTANEQDDEAPQEGAEDDDTAQPDGGEDDESSEPDASGEADGDEMATKSSCATIEGGSPGGFIIFILLGLVGLVWTRKLNDR